MTGNGAESATAQTSDQTIGYADAVDELNSILRDLDDDQLDIDVLAERVERAAQLITICRDRIGVAKVRVDEIVAGIEGGDDGTES